MARAQTKTGGRGGGSALYIPVAVLLVLFACIIGVSVFLKVSTVEVRGAGGRYPPEDVIKASGIKKGDNLMLLDIKAIADKLRAQMPYLENVNTYRKLPDTIVIELTERTPVAFVYSGGSGWLIDSKCKVLDAAGGGFAALIRIDGITPVDPVPGEYLSLGDVPATRLAVLEDTLKAIEAAGIVKDVQSLDITNIANIAFRYQNRFTVMLGDTSQLEYKLELLSGIVSGRGPEEQGKITLSSPVKPSFEPA